MSTPRASRLRRLLALGLALAAWVPARAAQVRVDLRLTGAVNLPGQILGQVAFLGLPQGIAPVLPASAIPVPPSQGYEVPPGLQPAPFQTPAGQEALQGKPVIASLQGIAQRGSGSESAVRPSADLAGKFFDQSGQRPPAASGSDSGVPQAPKLPPGVKRVSVDEVNTAADVDRLIPYGENSKDLISKLKRDVRKMVPYQVYTYHDAFGGTFTGLDLSAHPNLVDHLPEAQSHEVRLIKKIQVWNQDLRVLVREDGKTPDLVIGGLVTELKSLIGREVDLTFLVNKANTQVLEHARRHGLGHGAVAVDLTHEDSVPKDLILKELNAWAKRTRTVVLDRIFVFGGADLKVFVRQGSGEYLVEEPAGIPSGSASGGGNGAMQADAQGVKTLQAMVRSGRLEQAHRLVNSLESAPNADPWRDQLARVREQLDGRRLVGKLRKLVNQRQLQAAAQVWENFGKTHPARTVVALESEVKALLPMLNVPQAQVIAEPSDAETIRREIEDPPKALREKGVRAVVTVYGSARTPAGSRYYEEARRLGDLIARYGQGQVAVATGGGPGIMEAANRGAFEAGGPSVGYNIELPEHEQAPNAYQTEGLSFEFEHFATRKINLRHGAMALVYFPGGFGTMDELFEVLTMMQTRKLQRVPIVLFGRKDYWSRVLDFDAFVRMGLVGQDDLKLFKFVETADEALAAIASSPAAR